MEAITKDFIEKLFSIKDKVAIVTGATGALGKAVAKSYALLGAKVIITGRNDEKLKNVVDEFKKDEVIVDYISGNPSDEEDVNKIVERVAEEYGQIDILFVSHGYNKPANILEQSVEEWQTIMDADLKSVYIFCKKTAEKMVEKGTKGKMVIVSSARSKMGMAGYTGYCASKGAADLMVQSMASDLTSKYGINVNTINPTVFRSDLTEWMFDETSAVYQNFLKRLPVGRLGEPTDFIGLAVLLASPASDFLTGGNYDATGGYWAC